MRWPAVYDSRFHRTVRALGASSSGKGCADEEVGIPNEPGCRENATVAMSCNVRHHVGIDARAGQGVTQRRRYRPAFTLVELLVVMAVIMVLIAIIVPTLMYARERGRRTVCRNHIHQFTIGIHLYAHDADSRLPSGGEGHTPVLSTEMHKTMTSLLGGSRPLVCPYLGKPFTEPGGWLYGPAKAYVIGYNYLGGHHGTPWGPLQLANAEWKSPQSAIDAPGLAIVTELNDWSKLEERTFAPHTARGAVVTYNEAFSGGGMPSADLGAAGGNRGLLDGSVSWRNMADMSIYVGSHGGEAVCLAAW